MFSINGLCQNFREYCLFTGADCGKIQVNPEEEKILTFRSVQTLQTLPAAIVYRDMENRLFCNGCSLYCSQYGGVVGLEHETFVSSD